MPGQDSDSDSAGSGGSDASAGESDFTAARAENVTRLQKLAAPPLLQKLILRRELSQSVHLCNDEQVFLAANRSPKVPVRSGHVSPPPDQTDVTEASTPLESMSSPMIGTRIAYPSRLVFRFDEARLRTANCWPVTYTLAGILQACRALTLHVAANTRFQRTVSLVRQPCYRQALKSEVDGAYQLLSAAEKAGILARARRYQQMLLRFAAQAGPVLLHRSDIPFAPVGLPGAQASATAAMSAVPCSSSPAVVSKPMRLATSPVTQALAPSLSAFAGLDRDLLKYLSLPSPKRPAANETALVLPFRLQLSPDAGAQFTPDLLPASSAATGHTSWWHTRLRPAAGFRRLSTSLSGPSGHGACRSRIPESSQTSTRISWIRCHGMVRRASTICRAF